MELIDISKLVDWIEGLYNSDLFSLSLKGVFIYLSALWIAIIIWVARDIINRSNSLIFQILMICLNIFLPVFGLILYLIIRPIKTLSEKYYEDLEQKMLEESGVTFCSYCGAEVEKEFLYCPVCTEQIKKKCSRCHKPYLIDWKLCPYCGSKGSKKKKTTKK